MNNNKFNADYIIIGAGSAGCALAGRLLENTTASILMLEAGGKDSSFLIPLPAGFTKLMPTKNLIHFRTEPQSGLDGRPRILPQGRVFGGGSSINAMVYIRGQAEDFNDWAAAGASGWSYQDVLPYFMRAEDNERFDDEFHGTGGPLGVSDPRYLDTMTRAFVRAAQDAGHRYNQDFNGTTQEGVGFCQTTTRGMKRSSAAKAYLHSQLNNPRLKVLTGAAVTRILMKGDRAEGAEFVLNGQLMTAIAGQEVILSAGAIQTPKLLMLSGIGPESVLKSANVQVRHVLNGVGQNFQDHVEVPVIAFCRPGKPFGYYGQDKGLKMVKNALQYMMFGSGMVTANVVEGHCFANSGTGASRADLQMQFLPLVYLDLLDRGFIHKAGGTINTCVTRPFSRGEIRLRSSNPMDMPIVEPNYLQDQRDIDATLSGVSMAREIMASKAFSPYLGKEEMPGPAITSREDLHNYLRDYGKTVYHPAGTCRMGTDREAVVTPDLKVRGIEGLRVVDNSIMPTLTSGNTNAPAIMIGEKASDIIAGRKPLTSPARIVDAGHGMTEHPQLRKQEEFVS